MRYIISLSFLLFSVLLIAQDTLQLADSSKAHKIVRIYYQNDFYTKTDYYFTQGEQVEVIHPVFDRFFLKKILVNQRLHSYSHTGVAFHGGGYTPKLLDTAGILFDDRPFAGYLYLGYFLETLSPKKDLFVRNELALGWIGPQALGKSTQVYLHQKTGSTMPLGWDNEIHTDFVVQYNIEVSRLLLSVFKIPLLWWEGKVKIGTLHDNLTLGFKIDAEPQPSVFGKLHRKFFLSPVLGAYATAVGYDALMQGGLLNGSSPYVLTPGRIERLVARGNAGIKLRFKKLQSNFFIEWISPEFKGGSAHSWGNMQLFIFL